MSDTVVCYKRSGTIRWGRRFADDSCRLIFSVGCDVNLPILLLPTSKFFVGLSGI